MQRRPVNASSPSVPMNIAPNLTIGAGTGGLQGRCNTWRRVRMNSAFVTGVGPVALYMPSNSGRFIDCKKIRFKSST